MWNGIEHFTLDSAQNVFGAYTDTVEKDFETKPYQEVKPEYWKRFKTEYLDAGGSSTKREKFLADFDDTDYFWDNIKNTRKALKNN